MNRICFKFVLFFLLVFAQEAIAGTTPQPLRPKAIEEEFTAEEVKLLELTNRKRKHKGLRPLKLNKTLTYVARKYSANMAHRRHLSHAVKSRAKNLEYRLKKSGYAFARAAENVARSKNSLPHVVHSWMKSPGHRKNILNPHFKEIGIGVAADTHGYRYFTQVFGVPKIQTKRPQ